MSNGFIIWTLFPVNGCTKLVCNWKTHCEFTAKCAEFVSVSISGKKVIMGNSQQADKTNLCSIFLVGLVARILGEGAEMVSDLCLAK